MATISVIIPVYNTEPFLPRSIESVIRQSHSDLEIVLINDCSTDHSAEVLDNYAKRDSRISVIDHESNKGLSAARNTGLEHAHGEYVYFLDSDDWIDLTYLEQMHAAARRSGGDIINNTNMLCEHPTGKQTPLFFGNLSQDCSGFLPANRLIYNIMWSSCTHLFRRNFLLGSGIAYPEGLIHEDMYFQPISYMATEHVYVIKGPAYHYRIRTNGICRATQIYTRYTDYFRILELVYEAMQKKHYLESHDVLLFPKNFLLPLTIRPDDTLLNTMQAYYAKALPYITKNKALYSEKDLYVIKDILAGKIPHESEIGNENSRYTILFELRKRVQRTERKRYEALNSPFHQGQ